MELWDAGKRAGRVRGRHAHPPAPPRQPRSRTEGSGRTSAHSPSPEAAPKADTKTVSRPPDRTVLALSKHPSRPSLGTFASHSGRPPRGRASEIHACPVEARQYPSREEAHSPALTTSSSRPTATPRPPALRTSDRPDSDLRLAYPPSSYRPGRPTLARTNLLPDVCLSIITLPQIEGRSSSSYVARGPPVASTSFVAVGVLQMIIWTRTHALTFPLFSRFHCTQGQFRRLS